MSRLVVIVVYPGVKLLDVAGPLQVFSDALEENTDKSPYEIKVVSQTGGLIETDTKVPVLSEPFANVHECSLHTLLIAGGGGSIEATENLALLQEVVKLAKCSQHVASVCTGALILAACGLLDDRRAVTHWQWCDYLSEHFPEVHVDADPIFIRDENVWTSAGVTAGIDLALALVSEDLGRTTALKLARGLVAYMVRPGNQSQFSDMLRRQSHNSEGLFGELFVWIEGNLDKNLSVERLAEHANMSTRNFARKFTQCTGETPAKAVESMRVEAARNLLEETDLPIELVGQRCGFHDDERMRRAFLRTMKVPPYEYRRRFQ